MKKLLLCFVFVSAITFFSSVSAELKILGSIQYDWTEADKQIATKIVSLIERKPRQTQEKWIQAIDTILFQNETITLRVRAILNAIQLNVRDTRENSAFVSPQPYLNKDLNDSSYLNSLLNKIELYNDEATPVGDLNHLKHGEFSARYLPSEDFTSDKIRIFDGTNTRTFSLSYNTRNAEILRTIEKKEGFNWEIALVTNGGLKFCGFYGFSPSGYYLNVNLCGREHSHAAMIDTSNGKTMLTYSVGSEVWTTDRKQFVWGNQIGMGGGDLGLNITTIGSFPNYKTIMNDRQIEHLMMDGDSLVVKSSLLSEEMTHYYITLVNPSTQTVLQEVKLARSF